MLRNASRLIGQRAYTLVRVPLMPPGVHPCACRAPGFQVPLGHDPLPPYCLYAGNRGVARFELWAKEHPPLQPEEDVGRRPAQNLLRYAWRRPDIYLAWTFHGPRRARPCRQRTVQPPGGADSAVPQPGPGHRPPAAPPPAPAGGQLRHQPQPPATFRLTTAGPQLQHPRPPRSVTSTRTTPSAARTATVSPSRPSRYAERCSRTARSPAAPRHPRTDAPARAPRP